QRLAGLSPGIIELARLADDDRAGADDENARDVGALRHRWSRVRRGVPPTPTLPRKGGGGRKQSLALGEAPLRLAQAAEALLPRDAGEGWGGGCCAASPLLFHHRDEPLKKVIAVLRPRTRFGVVLDGEDRLAFDAQAFIAAVEQRHMGRDD